MRILLLNAEFSSYAESCRASYAGNYGLEEAFTALGHEVVTVPLFSAHGARPVEWDRHLTAICGDKPFDQLWFEVCHTYFGDDLMARFRDLAPVRVGVVWETMRSTHYERTAHPESVGVKDGNFIRKLPLATHLVAVDSSDVEDFEKYLGIPSFWTAPTFVNRAFIEAEDAAPQVESALFFGTPYGHRKSWLEHPELKPLLYRPDSPEWATSVPHLYDKLLIKLAQHSRTAAPFSAALFFETVRQMKKFRRLGFKLWLDGLRQGVAVVNLPQLGSTLYAGRVIESMAVARVAITPVIKDRPRNHALFKEGEEIFHYPPNDPHRLAEIIRFLQHNPERRRQMEIRARQAILERHTTEFFLSNVLRSIASGERPAPPPPRDPEEVPHEVAECIRTLMAQQKKASAPSASQAQAPKPARPLVQAMREVLQPSTTHSAARIASFAADELGFWVAQQTPSILPGSQVVEVALRAGNYRSFFEKCFYEEAAVQEGLAAKYPAGADIVLCSEVLQHVPKPIELLEELARITCPGGRLLLTSSFAPSLDVSAPYYGSFGPDWYRHYFRKLHLFILELSPNGGLFRWLSSQLPKAATVWGKNEERFGPHWEELKELFAELLPGYLFELENRLCDDRFTTGYRVMALKVDSLALADAFIAANPSALGIHLIASDLAEKAGDREKTRHYLREILKQDPAHAEAKARLAATA